MRYLNRWRSTISGPIVLESATKIPSVYYLCGLWTKNYNKWFWYPSIKIKWSDGPKSKPYGERSKIFHLSHFLPRNSKRIWSDTVMVEHDGVINEQIFSLLVVILFIFENEVRYSSSA